MRATIKRRSIPSAGSIHWKPLRDPHYVLASIQPDNQYRHIYVEQAVLLRVHDVAQSQHGQYAFGLLVGDQCECPSTGLRYVTVRSLVEHSAPALNEAAAMGAIVELLDRPIERGAAVLGWYCCGGPVDLRLTHSHTAMHASAFPQPWQTGLLVARSATSGGFFLRDVRESRWFTAPFFEMTTPTRERAKLTCISWETYLTTDTVVPLRRPERRVSHLSSAIPAARAPAPAANPAHIAPVAAVPAPARTSPAPRPAVLSLPTSKAAEAPAPAPAAAAAVKVPRQPWWSSLAPTVRAAWSRFGRGATVAGAVARRSWRVTARLVNAGASRTGTAAAIAARWLGSSAVRASRSAGALVAAAARAVAVRASSGVRITGRAATAGATATAALATKTFVRRAPPPAANGHATPRPGPPMERPPDVRPDERPTTPTFRDTTATDAARRYVEVARIEGFFIAGTFDTDSPAERETLWVLHEPRVGLLLTIVAAGSELREATLHYNVHPDDAPWLATIPPERRDPETGTVYITEPCIESLRARCMRLRASGKLEREWKLSPKIQLITRAEREALSTSTALHALTRRRIAALSESVRRQFRLGQIESPSLRGEHGTL